MRSKTDFFASSTCDAYCNTLSRIAMRSLHSCTGTSTLSLRRKFSTGSDKSERLYSCSKDENCSGIKLAMSALQYRLRSSNSTNWERGRAPQIIVFLVIVIQFARRRTPVQDQTLAHVGSSNPIGPTFVVCQQ